MTTASADRPIKRTRAPGESSRRRVLEHAARLASIEGLEGLTVGKLADASSMPKSSVYQLFGSREDIQLATVEAARESFIRSVVLPTFRGTEPGLQRLRALCEGYLDHVEQRVFPAGCFFVAAAAEMGGRVGPVHDRVAQIQQSWRDVLLQEAQAADAHGELTPGTDPAQLAFELGAMMAGANVLAVLHDDQTIIDRARASVRARIGEN